MVEKHGEEGGSWAEQSELEQTLLAGDISKQTHDTIEQQINRTPAETGGAGKPPVNANVIAGLLLGSPEFQRK